MWTAQKREGRGQQAASLACYIILYVARDTPFLLSLTRFNPSRSRNFTHTKIPSFSCLSRSFTLSLQWAIALFVGGGSNYLNGLRGWGTCACGRVKGRCRTLSSTSESRKFEQRKNTPRDVHVDDYMPIPMRDDIVYHHGVGWLVVYSFAGHFPEPVCGIDKDTSYPRPFYIQTKLKCETLGRDSCRDNLWILWLKVLIK